MLDAALSAAPQPVATLPGISLRVLHVITLFGQPLRVLLEPGFVHEDSTPEVVVDTPDRIEIRQRRTREWVTLGPAFAMSWAEPPLSLEAGQIFTGDFAQRSVELLPL